MSIQRFKKSSFEAVEGALKAALNTYVTKSFAVLMTESHEAGYDNFKTGLRKAVGWYERVLDDIEEVKARK